MYDFIGYVRTGSNFLRMLCAIEPIFDASTMLVEADVPREAELIANEIRDHMLHHFQEFKSAYASKHGTRPPWKALEACKARWREFTELFAGALVATHEEGEVIKVYIGAGRNSSGVDRPALVKKMTRSYEETFMTVLPVRPEYGKWTFLSPAVG